jgi:hypothetical protein
MCLLSLNHDKLIKIIEISIDVSQKKVVFLYRYVLIHGTYVTVLSLS